MKRPPPDDQRCTAPCRTTQERCRNPAEPGRDRCAYHPRGVSVAERAAQLAQLRSRQEEAIRLAVRNPDQGRKLSDARDFT